MPTAADLHVAVTNRNVVAVERLASSGMNINGTVQGCTPLSLAIYRKYIEIAQILIRCGADVNFRSKDHLDRIEPPLYSACRLGYDDAVRALLTSPNLDINQKDFFNKTSLWIATKERRVEIAELLINNNADVNISDNWCECPLYLATRYRGRRKIAELLIRSGCRLNVEDSEGRTPLYWTVRQGERAVFELLIRAGCRIQRVPWLATQNLRPRWRKDKSLCNWIEELQLVPRKLRDISINCIRRWLALRWKRLRREHVDELPIPDVLKDAIMLED